MTTEADQKAPKTPLVIPNLFRDNKRRQGVMLKQVQHDDI
jgi:hypothetical protein